MISMRIACVALLLTVSAVADESAPGVPLRFAKPRLLGSGFGDAPRVPLVADLDGDGFGDLISVDLEGGICDVALSVRGGKHVAPANATGDLGKDLVAVATRPGANGRAELVARTRDGARRVLSFGDDQAWHVAVEANPAPPDGVTPSTAASAGAIDSAASSTAAPTLKADFDGDGAPDELVGATVRLAADTANPVVVREIAALPAGAVLVAGDINGDKRDDLIAFRCDDAWRTGRDILAFLSFKDGDPDPDGDGLDAATESRFTSDPLAFDTDNDGIGDGCEVKGEGSLDFPVLGASPVQKDCFVYVQRYSDTDGAHCAREIARCVKTWAEMPNRNPDGSTGIALHPIWLPPLRPGTPGRAWWDLGNEFLPKEARGLAHYMELNNGGGGQAAELGDMGGCGTGALWACFLHEFGHQVGLTHSGGPLPGMCPTYTSLMSYAYSYGFEDDGNKIHYSTGELASLVLNEARLTERIELPFTKLAFLAKGPFGFKVEPDDPDPAKATATRVDWNRNGTFDDGTVRADVTDVYGAGCVRFGGAGKTVFAPVLVDHRGQLVLLTVTREKALMRRVVVGQDKFDAVAPVLASGVITPTGDPAAVSDGSTLTVCVPTAEGIVVLSAADVPGLDSATPQTLPETLGLAVSASAWRGRAVLLLWKDAESPIRVMTADAAGRFVVRGDLGALRSDMAPGAAEDPSTGEFTVGTCLTTPNEPNEKAEKGEHRAWIVTRFAAADDAPFSASSSSTVGGPSAGWYGNSRPMLVFERGPGSVSEGRLHFIGRGYAAPADSNGCFYEAITIGDQTANDGWRLRRWIDEWTTTRSPIGAALHAGGTDLAIVYRWAGNVHGDDDDEVHVLLNCFSIDTADMHDFDDVSLIADIGLERSILWRDAAAR